jgi:hypothetical protein
MTYRNGFTYPAQGIPCIHNRERMISRTKVVSDQRGIRARPLNAMVAAAAGNHYIHASVTNTGTRG